MLSENLNNKAITGNAVFSSECTGKPFVGWAQHAPAGVLTAFPIPSWNEGEDTQVTIHSYSAPSYIHL